MDAFLLKLPQFEGPLELLYALVQKEEIEISSLSLNSLVFQMAHSLESSRLSFDLSAESIAHASHLLWVKSKALLPQNQADDEFSDEESDLKGALLEKLVEYCRFKEAAASLSLREEKAKDSYGRPVFQSEEPFKKQVGLEHVGIKELAVIFQEAIVRLNEITPIIEGESWSVSDKMQEIRLLLRNETNIPVEELFASSGIRMEVIVLFLAILELMKLGELSIVRFEETLNLRAANGK